MSTTLQNMIIYDHVFIVEALSLGVLAEHNLSFSMADVISNVSETSQRKNFLSFNNEACTSKL